eukprot:CAMPEP_0184394670 /NCGR_PEP_ID=MMETSP0007-20130409/40410_1 /TAXON_ID=97485 /ORGANISM="Prymnesium parvum, Strain Texoma1" /LENGTH=74 /DNA_ID=CAMNT_0026746345 /DNA_START=585 /DNA_END=807 /DNA_ORIENTATION=-
MRNLLEDARAVSPPPHAVEFDTTALNVRTASATDPSSKGGARAHVLTVQKSEPSSVAVGLGLVVRLREQPLRRA